MGKYLKEIGNPLGIIGFFLVLVEGIAGMVIVNSSLPTFLNTILVIFTVTFPILVLIAFFKLVTEHHEKLYAPKDYADETNFVKTFYNFESKQSNEIIVGNQTQNISQIKSESTIIEEFDIIEEDISVSNLANASSLVNQYINIGYEASIYNSECSSTKDNTAIWLGTQVSLRNAKEIIKIAHEYYPHLKYIHLSTDGDNTPPERIHRQVYISGTTIIKFDCLIYTIQFLGLLSCI